MNPVPAELLRMRAALHPLPTAPAGPGWNLAELSGLLLPDIELQQAAVLLGLVPRPAGIQVLLTRRTDALRHHAGQVSLPGGRIEPEDANAAAAAIREAGEEIGLTPAQIEPLGWLDPLCTITGFRVLPLVAAIAPDYQARPDPREVDAVFEVPLDFLLAPEHLAWIQITHGGRPRPVLEFVDRGIPEQRIWGATASILFNLRQRLGAWTSPQPAPDSIGR
ncbi:MAG: CoA pyrophosphatase [Gammaproteobacteria bacterium]|nr:CoA pyrophosphatase [Gammaproteobacteria bacterium]